MIDQVPGHGFNSTTPKMEKWTSIKSFQVLGPHHPTMEKDSNYGGKPHNNWTYIAPNLAHGET